VCVCVFVFVYIYIYMNKSLTFQVIFLFSLCGQIPITFYQITLPFIAISRRL